MNKYVSSILKTIFALIVILNAGIISARLVKSDEDKYSKTNFVAYLYDIAKYDDEDITVEEPKVVPDPVKVEEKVETIIPEVKPVVPENNTIEYPVLETFVGSITGYGPDCYGCSGIGNTSSGHNLITEGIYYQDKTFGSIRIVAADPKFRFGTVVRISGLKIYDEPILAVVLDRGGAIKGEKMDLAFDTESDPLIDQIGYSKNIQYEVLRYGW